MQRQKRAVVEVLWELHRCIELHAERRGVRWKKNIRNDRRLHEVWHLSDMQRIVMLTNVAERPAVETALFHRRCVIGNQIISEIVAFIDGGPEDVRSRLPCKRCGIPQSRSE